MPDLHQIPHLDEIAHHGEYHGVGKRVTETFADRYHHQIGRASCRERL